MPELRQWAEVVGSLVEAAGVLVIVAGLLVATWRYLLVAADTGAEAVGPYRRYRQDLGRAILVGLEILVAGDIIRTVATEPTLTSVAVLAGIVLIRTFLSMSIEVELEGRWPWQRGAGRSRPAAPTAQD